MFKKDEQMKFKNDYAQSQVASLTHILYVHNKLRS